MNHRRAAWPLALIATPAAVAIWSGWVGLGGLCGFGPVNLLPGIGGGFTINTAITLPVGVEAYAAFALGAWLSPSSSAAAKRFAMWSAFGALAYGMAGQVAYHLLTAAHVTEAPWPVVVVVSCMPVAVLGFAAGLAHLLRSGEDVAGGRAGASPRPPATSTSASLRAFVPPVREIQGRQQCSPTTAGKARKEMQLLIRRIENEMSPPAGMRRPPSAPAGASGQDVPNPGGALAALNGHQPAGRR